MEIENSNKKKENNNSHNSYPKFPLYDNMGFKNENDFDSEDEVRPMNQDKVNPNHIPGEIRTSQAFFGQNSSIRKKLQKRSKNKIRRSKRKSSLQFSSFKIRNMWIEAKGTNFRIKLYFKKTVTNSFKDVVNYASRRVSMKEFKPYIFRYSHFLVMKIDLELFKIKLGFLIIKKEKLKEMQILQLMKGIN